MIQTMLNFNFMFKVILPSLIWVKADFIWRVRDRFNVNIKYERHTFIERVYTNNKKPDT